MRTEGGRRGIGVMKDKKIKLEETEVSFTLGGVREVRVQVRRKCDGSGEGSLSTTRISPKLHGRVFYEEM